MPPPKIQGSVLKQMYDRLNSDGQGEITADDAATFMRSAPVGTVGKAVAGFAAEQFVTGWDVEKTGGVSFGEFTLVAPYMLQNMMRAVTPPPGAVLPSEYIAAWQKQINPGSPGMVMGQLARFLEKNLKESGLNVGAKSAATFIAAVAAKLLDGDSDGVINEAELNQVAVEADALFLGGGR